MNESNDFREPQAEGTKRILRITPEVLIGLKRLGEPQLHPDGRHIAFTVTEADFHESRMVSHVWLAVAPEAEPDSEIGAEGGVEEAKEPDGTEPVDPRDEVRQLTFSLEGERAPTWSPDGRSLAFLSSRFDPTEPDLDDDEPEEPGEQLWLMPTDAGEARRLTRGTESILDYCWLPDSSGLVYLSQEPRPGPIEVARQAARDRRKNDPTVEIEERRRRQIWSIDLDQEKPRLLYRGDPGIDEIALHPSGDRLAFTTNRTGEPNDYHIADLYLLTIATGEARLLSGQPGGKYRMRWSPSGDRLAYLSWLDPELSYSRESLFVLRIDEAAPDAPDSPQEATGTEKLVGDGAAWRGGVLDYDRDILEFEWSRHDGAIYALAAEGVATPLLRITDRVESVSVGGSAHRHGLHLDPEGAGMVCVEEGAAQPEELAFRDAEGASSFLTRLNEELARDYRIPRQEVISWTSSDGLVIEGVLTHPIDVECSEKAPLVVQVHGGPKGRAQARVLGYTLPLVWASEGYRVLQPNFRGSEGYGNAFAIANRRDLGGGDFADIVTGVELCIERGLADRAQIGIMGGSYGGFMTNWAIGHSDLFGAAVSMFGIFHLQTDYSNSELSRWDNDYLGAYYWEDAEIYRRCSPGGAVDRITTPTLVVHGDQDNNTSLSNSRELFQALRHRGVPTQFVHYPREGHGLNEPNHRLDETHRALDWMDLYLRGGGRQRTRFRAGEAVPSNDGEWELMVNRASTAELCGARPAGEGPDKMAHLEVSFTIRQRPGTRRERYDLRLGDVRLASDRDTGAGAAPVAVPLDLPGGKVLLEGENLRLPQWPDPTTGEIAFPAVVLFEVPSGQAEGWLRAAGFPPIALTWKSGSESDAGRDDASASKSSLPDGGRRRAGLRAHLRYGKVLHSKRFS